MVHTPKKSSDVAMKFVLSIITVYLPRSDEIVEPGSIHQAPSITKTLSIQKFVRQISDRGDCSIEFFKTVIEQEAFHTQWYNKAGDVFLVTRSPIKAIASVQRAGNGIKKTGVNGSICEQWFHETCFYV